MKAWTFEPLEMCPENTWDIYDPNAAQLIATFYDHKQAKKYLRWINKKQAKKQAKKDKRQVFL